MTSRRRSRLAMVAWAILAVDVILVLALGARQFAPHMIAWLLLLVAWLLLSLFVVAIVLPIIHRHALSGFRGWSALLGMYGLSVLVQEGIILPEYAGLRPLSLLAAVFGGISILVSLGLLLRERDVGVLLLGWSSLIWIWTLALSARRSGSLIISSLRSMRGERAEELQWTAFLTMAFCCILPFALIAVVVHTVLLLRREREGASPPPVPEHEGRSEPDT